MKIGILQTAYGDIGQYGKFYNTQEIGLAKALAALGHTVNYYKFVKPFYGRSGQKRALCPNADIIFVKARYFGNNGIAGLSALDKTMEILIYFSDIQMMVPAVYHWCLRNGIGFLPYAGALESHSTSAVRRTLMKFFENRSFQVYRKTRVLAKTPAAEDLLRKKGAENVTPAPVGLDESLLFPEYENVELREIYRQLRVPEGAKVLLFIGRMEEEKQPLVMLSVFQEILKNDKSYFLFMVGRGELLPAVRKKASSLDLTDKIRFVEEIRNSEIWKLYRAADCFVNLNRNEIFGMCILEAMYYGCPVAALKAPGPSCILEDGKYGKMVEDESQIVSAVLSGKYDIEAAKKHVREKFLWSVTAPLIIDAVCRTGKGEESRRE